MSKYELLAPAGDLPRLKTAVDFGADAVFIGGKKYSLRYRASNFDLPEIQEGVDYCHKYGAKLFVTANMIYHDTDLEGLKDYFVALEEIGVDAVIVASLYAVSLVKKFAPKIEAHLSTQLSTLNSKAVEYLKTMGADRVVLGRETTMEEVAELMSNTKVPIEAFVHGGMCTNYSGRCTLSNYMTNRDANRGGCAQSCRWNYMVYDGDKNLISDPKQHLTMSSKDMRTIDVLDDLLKTGVYSLKIEGRMKSEYYLANVVSAYRLVIDAFENNEDVEAAKKAANKILAQTENRESFAGFYEGKDFSYDGYIYHEKTARVNQNFLGIIKETHDSLVTLQVRNKFSIGEKVEVFGPNNFSETFVVDTLINSKEEAVESVRRPMELIQIKVPFDVKENYFVRRIG
ncbi:MAG: U32 family peptidase [Erysipelothrix sp.]|nr:U32 family peptidase [Erysipelothrix sp.]